jgi:hypothetical protein
LLDEKERGRRQRAAAAAALEEGIAEQRKEGSVGAVWASLLWLFWCSVSWNLTLSQLVTVSLRVCVYESVALIPRISSNPVRTGDIERHRARATEVSRVDRKQWPSSRQFLYEIKSVASEMDGPSVIPWIRYGLFRRTTRESGWDI